MDCTKNASEGNRQYDQKAKEFLSNKAILAWILRECVEEFKPFSVEQIIEEGLDGDPEVSNTPVDRPMMLEGISNEDGSAEEGLVTYDIRVAAFVPGTDQKVQLIINIEAQKDKPSEYAITKRGIYYCSRMVSAQKNTRFTGRNYDDICKVYSIWVLMNVAEYEKNSIVEYTIDEHRVVGGFRAEKDQYDILTMIVLALGDEQNTDWAVLKLLDTIFTLNESGLELRRRLKDEFKINLTPKMEREVDELCNLSIGIEERGMEKQARESNRRMRDDGISLMNRAAYVGYPAEIIETWDTEDAAQEKKEPTLV